MNCSSNKQNVSDLANNLSLQILGMSPKYITKKDVPANLMNEEVEKVKKELGDKIKGKPEKVLE